MSALNLLPTELTPKPSILKLVGVVKKISTALAVILVFFLIGVVAMFILNSIKIKELKAQESGLKTAVSALEKTEKQLVLMRDRIIKVKKVWEMGATYINADAVRALITQNEGIVSFASLDITSKKVNLQVVSPTSSGVARFLSGLVASDLFKSINLKSLSFSPLAGYSLDLELSQ
jgi:hypothetical protein